MLTTMAWLLVSSLAAAQDGVSADRLPVSASVTAGALMSVQPVGYDGLGGPYLDNALGGIVPGVFGGFQVVSRGALLFGLELTTTSRLEVLQSGRFVIGDSPRRAVHRDTLVSFLSGMRVPVGGGSVEPKAGVSLVFGEPRQGTFSYENAAGFLALTLGLDVAVPISGRVHIAPTFRYSLVDRGDDSLYTGLGRHILRAGAGIRVDF